MFRIKIALVLLMAFASVGFVVYFNIADAVTENAENTVVDHLSRARRAVVQSRTIRDFAVEAKAAEVTRWPQFGELLAKPDQAFAAPGAKTQINVDDAMYARHQSVYEEVLVWQAKFSSEGKGPGNQGGANALEKLLTEEPELFVIVDANGIGVADASDPAKYGVKTADVGKEHPVVMNLLKDGGAIRDIWRIRDAPMSVGVWPIRYGGKIVGAAILGYRLTDAEARRESQNVNAEVAFLIEGHVRKSSSVAPGQEGSIQDAMNEQIKAAGAAQAGKFSVKAGGKQYRGNWARLKGYASANAYVGVLRDVDAAIAGARTSLFIVPVAMALGFILCLGLLLSLFNIFIRPIKNLDDGVMEIMNGNLDFWFQPVGGELAQTMAQNLNIMVCQLSGRPLPDEDDQVQSQNWVRDQMFTEAIDSDELERRKVAASVVDTGEMAMLPPAMLRLLREDDETYARRTFSEYVEALQATGEPMAGITFHMFVREMESNAEVLKEKLSSNRVRFLVEVEDGKPSLKPVPLD